MSAVLHRDDRLRHQITEPRSTTASPGRDPCRRQPDSPVFPSRRSGRVGRSYNVIIDKAAEYDDLEALVLVHPDTEIVDPEFCAKVRSALADPEVGVVGGIGATRVESIAWWTGGERGLVIQRYSEWGGGDLPGFACGARPAPPPAEVDSVDGLHPRAVAVGRPQPALRRGARVAHGYDVDYCLQVREAGHKVMTADLGVITTAPSRSSSDTEGWIEAHMRGRRQVGRRDAGAPPRQDDWRQRALRAEAEREAARAAGRCPSSSSTRRASSEFNRTHDEMATSYQLADHGGHCARLNHWRRQAMSRGR